MYINAIYIYIYLFYSCFFFFKKKKISSNTAKLVKGEGMPIYNSEEFKVEFFNKPLQKGNLYVKFDIEFPSKIDENRRDDLI